MKAGSSEVLRSGYMDEDEEPEGDRRCFVSLESKSVLEWSFVLLGDVQTEEEHGDLLQRGSQTPTPFCSP